MVSKRRPTPAERDERVKVDLTPEDFIGGVLEAGPHPDPRLVDLAAEVRDALRARGAIPDHCPQCGDGQEPWTIQAFVALPVWHDDSAIPAAPLNCRTCGFTMLFMTDALGVNIDEGPDQ